MTKRVNIDMANLRRVLSAGLATTALAIVLIYVLGAQAILQTPQAEAGHILLMSLIQGIEGHALQSQMHGGPESGSQMQEMKQGAMFGIIGNNVLGTPKTISAGGLAVVVVTSAILLSAAAFVVSGRRLSFLVPGLLTTSGIILMILPLLALVNANFVVIAFQGPIVGVTIGLVIFGLGVAGGLRTIRTAAAAAK